jgi:type IV pilus assembly protein PilC
MSTYVFKAIDLTGSKAKGEVEADSKQAVSDQLKQRGLIVLDIADKHSSKEIEIGFLKRVTANDLAVFSRQLSTMISSRSRRRTSSSKKRSSLSARTSRRGFR